MAEFSDAVQQLDRGRVETRLSAAIQKAVATSRQTNLPSKITLTLKIIPEGDVVKIVPEIKQDFPQPKHNLTVFFVDEGNRLTRSNPRQEELPLQPIE